MVQKKMVQKEIVPKNGPKYTHYFSCHTPKGVNTGFAKGEAQIRHAYRLIKKRADVQICLKE